ncbi:MAG: adenylate/guanylate cyclase domain-containing protein [Pseudomonadota bacterium]
MDQPGFPSRLMARAWRGLLSPGLMLRGSLGGDRLPERVQQDLIDQETESERLIGWAQLLFVSVFAALYLVAPRPIDAPMMIAQPVPIALVAYGAFTVMRLMLAYRGYIPAWMLVLSICVDIGLVLGLVWYFHIQYLQPAAFSLKVPTFVYLFAFISLRALRFDPRYVMLSGLIAAFGWLLLVGWAIAVSAPDTVTRSFTEYVNGNRILRGAEFGKVFVILTVTAVLTLAIWRARQMLVRALTEVSNAREMKKFLSRGVAETIVSQDGTLSAGQAIERDAVIVMIDIRGFSNFSGSVTPREIVEMLTSYHDRIVPVINRHRGVVDKFMGDGVMATFGAVSESKTAAEDAMRAIEEIIRTSERWRQGNAADERAKALSINLAAASGTVVFATLGSDDRLEYTVIGTAANLAAKLEKHNKAEGTMALVTRDLWDAAKSAGYRPRVRSEPRPGRAVAGISAPLDLVAVRA